MNPCHCLNPPLICMDFYSIQFHSQFGSIITVPNPNFFVCSLTMEMGPLNISSSSNTGKVLLVEDSRKTSVEEKTLLPSSLCFLVNVLHHMQFYQCLTPATWTDFSEPVSYRQRLLQHPASAACLVMSYPNTPSIISVKRHIGKAPLHRKLPWMIFSGNFQQVPRCRTSLLTASTGILGDRFLGKSTCLALQ